MSDILDPAGGVYAISNGGGTLATFTYTPNTTADINGDGDTDTYALWRDVSTYFGGSGFLDSNAAQPQIFEWEHNRIIEDPNGNARLYMANFIDAISYGGKNAGSGIYMEMRSGGDRFGTTSGRNKVTLTALPLNTLHYFRLTFDPAADTVTLEIFTDSARTALDQNAVLTGVAGGGDAVAGGQPILELFSTSARGKGTAIYQDFISSVGLPVSGAQAAIAVTDGSDVAAMVVDVQAISITHVFKDSAGTAFWADGIAVTAYEAATIATANPGICGVGTIGNVNAGVGEVYIQLNSSVPCILVPDHLDANAPLGEQAITESLTPVIV